MSEVETLTIFAPSDDLVTNKVRASLGSTFPAGAAGRPAARPRLWSAPGKHARRAEFFSLIASRGASHDERA